MAGIIEANACQESGRDRTHLPGIAIHSTATAAGKHFARYIGMGISPVTTNLPEAIKSPGDALAIIAVKKGIDVQNSQAAALVALLDVNIGRVLNASA